MLNQRFAIIKFDFFLFSFPVSVSGYSMSSPSSQLATLRRMSIYEPFHQISMWGDTFHGDASPNTGSSTIVQVDTRLDNQVILEVFFFGYRLSGFFHLISWL